MIAISSKYRGWQNYRTPFSQRKKINFLFQEEVSSSGEYLR